MDIKLCAQLIFLWLLFASIIFFLVTVGAWSLVTGLGTSAVLSFFFFVIATVS